ncbi:complement C5 [Parambassis ranga]|uniref:Complement C5 n=1 Tax=Parambassis ranga TaxID=210632 RepID=A0A6P7J2F6_9TELE|nr:complement C5 [Parambassis ranga]
MKVCVLLVCVWCLCWGTEAQQRSYMITAPLSLRLDAVETVLLQLFGYTDEVTVYVFLRTSMASHHLSQYVVKLNPQNHFQAAANVRLHPNQVDKNVNHVILHVQSEDFNSNVPVSISRSNGFLFIQTDKPLYNPHQTVKVRTFSLNQELRPANRSVFLTFKDPDLIPVDMVEMIDKNNGIPSMQNPFKIPIKPKLGIWTIEASYSKDFTTFAKTDFEVKEYVLPSFSIQVEPEVHYISYAQFNRFSFKVSAKYLHGAPVGYGEVFLRYGYVSGKNPPVIIPNLVKRERLSSSGEVDVTIDIQKILSKHDGPNDLSSLRGKYLYIAALLEENTGGIAQEVEFAAVKFVKSPYHLSLVSTPPFIKPGLPYNIQVMVKDHLEQLVSNVPVRLVKRQLVRSGVINTDMQCTESANSDDNGVAIFICNVLRDSTKAVLKFETADRALSAASQASLTLEAVAYHSPNGRYLYIDPPLPGQGLKVGRYANIKLFAVLPANVHIKSFNYLVLSRGKVVHFNSVKYVFSSDHKHTLSFEVTPSMVPSIRLLVYYMPFGEQMSELVADSIWLDVSNKCVNGLQTDLSVRKRTYKPKETLSLNVRTNQDGLVALSAVDSALFTLRPHYRDPVSRVLRHIEHSDQGCGGGGGRNAGDVFRLAGLTFITNAIAEHSAINEACTAVVRPKRALTEEDKASKAQTYGPLKTCCEQGMRYIPKVMTCHKFAAQAFRKLPPCRRAFRECCEYIQQNLDQDQNLILGRHEMGADFDLAPSLVRSYFPESWMWEVQPVRSGQASVTKTLPDSLTTWEIKAVAMFNDGVCVAEPVQVSVNLPLSVDVPLPYQVVRGEQLELTGSVYNQLEDSVSYCVTLTVGPAVCLLDSQPAAAGAGLRSTKCRKRHLAAKGVAVVAFTVLGLEAGEHTLTFTLQTEQGRGDVLEKKLRVVPEGVRQEVESGGRLDPRGLYGSERRTVVLKTQLPDNIVPNTGVERLLTITGEVPGEVLTVMHDPEGLRQLANLPPGSAEAELGSLLPLVQVYQFLETTRSWGVLGEDIQQKSADLKWKISGGLVSISSYKNGDNSYSMWMKRESSTWMTAQVVSALARADQLVLVDHQSLSDSVSWLIRKMQQPDGSFVDKSFVRPIKLMGGGRAVDQSVYLTSFALIALCRATRIDDPILQLQFHDIAMTAAADYISQHASGVKSVYVRAVATYALTLHDPNSAEANQLYNSLEGLAYEKGTPTELRFWKESTVAEGSLKPDQSSGLTVETTAYVLLTVLLKGRIQYANPILSWLTQDQHYGEGFYSVQDTVLTLEALTEYSKVVPKTRLDQIINVRYNKKGVLTRVHLSSIQPLASPIQITKNDDIIVSTGLGSGVSDVKMKTVYYQTEASTQGRCNFDLTIEVVGADASSNPSLRSPHLVACAKYQPPPNEVYTESSLTVMKIQLPTGVDAYLEDLKQFRDTMEPIISHYEQQGNTIVIQMDTVPSDIFLCVGFRVRTSFRVRGASESLFSVTEPQDKGSLCTKRFSYEEQRLQRFCMGEECQCMTAACAMYREGVDPTLTADKRTEETCRPHIKYAYRVTVRSAAAADGDFMTYTATVTEVLKNTEFEAVRSGTEVQLVKKATCSGVNVQNNKQYLVMGASGSEVTSGQSIKYRLPLDSDALVELWPTDCSSPDCQDYSTQLQDFALDLQLSSCP